MSKFKRMHLVVLIQLGSVLHQMPITLSTAGVPDGASEYIGSHL